MKHLKLRLRMKRKKPVFVMQGSRNLKRLGERWRKPRGIHSKLREHKTAKGFLPRRGYGSPKDVKFLHPSGFEEKLVYNFKDLMSINSQKQACKIASSVGRKKRIEIMKKAEELKIKVLNPLRIETEKTTEKV
ncbi:50S ribosomal protein L32e [Candidatus Micrarchaeota archaeon RBG_16_36_9]|nr:MAG: 50S ribosomal protein L32e [Candidatus Micrarchaeota archaeon RBG_16_36_9]